MKGPIVLQLNRFRNVSYPKIGEANHADGIVRIFLTDGHGFISAIILEKIIGISADTPPGTKILLTGDIHMEGSFIVLTKNNVSVLGGKVHKLIEKWVIEKNQMFKDNRTTKSNAPKWIHFGKKGAAAATSKGINSKGFKANDVIHSSTKKDGTDENDGTFDLQRREQIEAAVQASAKKFAAPQIQAPVKSQPSAEEQERIQLKRQRERQAKVDLGHDRRHKGRRGKRGSDDEEEIPAEFARPSAPSLLFDFLADTVPEATKAHPPQNVKNRFSEGQGGFSGLRDRGQGKDGKPRENHKQIPRQGKVYGETNTRGKQNQKNYGVRDTKYAEKHVSNNDKQTGREYHNKRDTRHPEKNERRAPERSYDTTFDKGEKTKRSVENQTDRFNNGENRQHYAPHLGSQSARGAPRNMDKMDQITQQISSLRMDSSSIKPDQQGCERSFKNGRGDKNNTQSYNDRSSKKEGPKISGQAVRDFVPRAQVDRDSRTSSFIPPLSSIMRRSTRTWNVGDKCLAPWQDGNLYIATIVYVNPSDMCTVRYDDYGNITTLPQGILITPE